MQDEKKIKKSTSQNEGYCESESSASEYHPRVVVMFREDPDLHYEDGADRIFGKSDSRKWYTLLKKFPGITINRLFRSLKPEAIHNLMKGTSNLDPTYERANLLGYYAVDCPQGVDPEAVVSALYSWKKVKSAYVEGGPTDPPVLNSPNDFDQSKQGYLGPAPGGIDAKYLWSRPGGDGEDVSGTSPLQFVDLERGWTLNHMDLDMPDNALISGVNKDCCGHGTAVLGIVAAIADNDKFGLGITPRLTVKRVVSQWRDNGSYCTSEAILDAISVLNFGDVLLLEAQTDTYGLRMPIEVLDDAFDVIRLGTTLGIIIIEAAGNGRHDLDNFRHPVKGLMFNRDSGDFQNSGAIMVGAASSSDPHTKKDGSNYGSRIDCYAWGENIYTIGDGFHGNKIDDETWYFDSTSGASAIIAGAALSLQGFAKAHLGYRLSPYQMRNVLCEEATGTASANGPADGIGVMPDLKKIADAIVIHPPPDIFIPGPGAPHPGAVMAAPDIVVRPVREPDPKTVFTDSSGHAGGNRPDFKAKVGQDNFIYLQVKSRGADAANVKATVYWSPVSALLTPDAWTEIGSVVVPSVPSGRPTVSDAILWPANKVPGPGQYGFVGVIGSPGDPAPVLTDFSDQDDFNRFIGNNNVVWRNLKVV